MLMGSPGDLNVYPANDKDFVCGCRGVGRSSFGRVLKGIERLTGFQSVPEVLGAMSRGLFHAY